MVDGPLSETPDGVGAPPRTRVRRGAPAQASALSAAALARRAGLAAAPAARAAATGSQQGQVHHFGRGLLLGFGHG